MKLPKSSGKPRRPRLFIVRRVSGDSMLPKLKHGQLVVASSLAKPKLGRIVIVSHQNKEKIKRLAKVGADNIYILGDNPRSSTDSRQFGWIAKSQLVATVIWPKLS